MIDGAGPFRVLRSVIIPQSLPAITAVALFHFFYAWNDFFVPLLYLANKPELQPLSIGIQQYNALFATQPTLVQAAALMTMAVPVVVVESTSPAKAPPAIDTVALASLRLSASDTDRLGDSVIAPASSV